MKLLARSSVLVFAVIGTCSAARAQTVLYTFNGNSSQEQFGFSTSVAGDTNGDGFDDLIVGAWNAAPAGAATLFSGADGACSTF